MKQNQRKGLFFLIITAFSVVIAGWGVNVFDSPKKPIQESQYTLSLLPTLSRAASTVRQHKDLLITALGIITFSLLVNYLGTLIFWRTFEKKSKKINNGSQDNYQLFHKIPAGVIVLNKKQEIDYINREAEKIFGFSLEEIRGYNFREIIPNFNINNSEKQSTITSINNANRDVKISIAVCQNKLQEEKILLLAQDIGERERKTIALEKEVKFISSIIDKANFLVLVLDRQARIIRMNSFCEKLSNCNPEESDKYYFWDLFFVPEEIEEYQDIFRRLISGESPIYFCGHLLNKNKDLHLVDWFNNVVLNQSGDLEYIVATGIDMTHRLNVEEALQKLNQDLEKVVEERTKELETINEDLRVEISQRQKIEIALQREVDLLARIMETSPVSIVVLDPQANIILASVQAEKVLGLTKYQNFQNTLARITDHEGNIIPNEELPLQQVLIRRQPIYNVENTIEWSDGKRIFLSINGAPLFGKQDKLEAVVLILEDVSRRVQADLIKDELIDRNQSMINALGEIVYEYDITSNIIYWGGNFTGLLGYDKDEMGSSRQSWLTRIYPDDRESVEEELATALVENRLFDTEYRLRCKDGSYRWIHDRGTINRDSYGRIIGVILDIAERKNAEAALKESEEKFRELVENINQVFWINSSDPREMLYISPAYEQVWGRSRESLYSQPNSWIESIHPQDRERIIQAFDKMTFEGKLIETYRITKPDGSIRWVSARSFAIRNPEGEIVRHIGIAEDITYRIEAENALQEANQKLTQWVNELEQRNQDMIYLEQMNDFLQSCMKVEEAYSVIGDIIKPMFPESSGGVFIIDERNNLVEAIATWGDSVSSETIFAVDHCWALRQGHLHSITCTQPNLFCKHINKKPTPARTLCVPMIAQGKALGLLYICFHQSTNFSQIIQNLARTVSEQLSLALANLQLRETLHQQSIRDVLTGLYNRRHMEVSLEREFKKARRKSYPLSIVMIDIDHFKRFNNNFGHEAGDAVLRTVGEVLDRNIRGSDIACRYGGEELILILPEASLENGYKRAEQIRKLVKSINLESQGRNLGVITASLGVACFPDHGETAEAVIKAADQALYQAKEEGRDRTVSAS
jgi:diguanylate cyclase (GGDEF)-like protein/PAS domain S-box-containing protein